MLADQERRARDGPSIKMISEKAACGDSDAKRKLLASAIPDRPERIAYLIAELDETTQGRFFGTGDWICLALKDEGEAAADALLECYATDSRMLTLRDGHRIFFGGSYDSYAAIIPVRDMDCDILRDIFDTDFERMVSAELKKDETLSEYERRARILKVIRREREKFKGLSQEERWYRQLADDSMPSEIWKSAAQNITKTVSVESSSEKPPPKSAVKFYGDALRDARAPSVSELLARRMNESLKVEDARDATEFAGHLETWDGKGPLDAMRAIAELLRVKNATNSFGGPFEATNMDVRRFGLGDRRALADNLAWLKQIPPPDEYFEKVLAFLWHFPDEPEVDETANFIFNDPASKWAELFVAPRRGKGMSDAFSLLHSPLLGVKRFREFALRQLADKAAAGRVTVLADGSRDLESTIFSLHDSDTASSDPLGRTPKPGEQFEFRMCDVAARELAKVPGFPRCELHWDEAARDRAVARCIEVLKRYGERLKFSAEQAKAANIQFDNIPEMLFPALNRPATAEDVENGLAIFSIPRGEGESRVWRLPKVPLNATWVSLKNHPCIKRNGDNEPPTLEYIQSGHVWQAEEVLKEGKWQRYYGFVGAYGIEKKCARKK